MSLMEIARLCQKTENDFVGARGGIMDYFAACFGRDGHPILPDCRLLRDKQVAMPGGVSMVVRSTLVRRALASSEYNQRQLECDKAVAVLSREFRDRRPALLFRRAQHVVSDNDRVLAAASAITRDDVHDLGQLMNALHRSLRDDDEVSCPELEVAVKVALAEPGAPGSRLMGGGFGGSTISLVEGSRVDTFRRNLETGYRNATSQPCETYVCTASSGASDEAV